MRTKIKPISLPVMLIAGIMALFTGCAQLSIPKDDVPLRPADGYFPVEQWRTSTPEAQGLE